MEIKFIENTEPRKKPEDDSTLGFGKIFTNHMFLYDWSIDEGWHDARIVPYGPLPLSPACTALHYGAEIFEGLKAYYTQDGEIQMFRPIENIRRMNNSADRMCLPKIDEDEFLQAMTELIKIDKEWIPKSKNTSLYIRPFMIGNDQNLGVHTCKHVLFAIILSPVGSYYKEGLAPVKIMIEDTDVRAVRGGTGEAKCGGNYGASTRAGEKAAKMGYSQVLWLDGVERKYIEEVGAMNVMFKINGEVWTPALTGSILPGITRKSIIQILKDEGFHVVEKKIALKELTDALYNGTLEEAWGCGTAAVVSPIGELSYMGEKFIINNNEIGPVASRLYHILTGIQSGKREDKYGWTYKVQ